MIFSIFSLMELPRKRLGSLPVNHCFASFSIRQRLSQPSPIFQIAAIKLQLNSFKNLSCAFNLKLDKLFKKYGCLIGC